ncbi:MAG: hypothetical protein AMXMBFR64_21170 [Myxococcales bacterium]
MDGASELPGSHSLAFIESLYYRYLERPESVDPAWRAWFAGQEHQEPPPAPGPSFRPFTLFDPPGGIQGPATRVVDDMAVRQDRVDQLVRAYRVRGHSLADLDPLGRARPQHPELELGYYGLTDRDLDRPFSARTLGGPSVRTLREIVEHLRDTYCRSIGVQYMHIDDVTIKMWLQDTMEDTRNRRRLSREEHLRILTKLTDAEIFEQFIQKKFLGAKRFSLEGGESLIPLLDQALEDAGGFGVEEVVIGMAHRGRLNVLANIMGKSPRQIFREFEDKDPDLHFGRGDVKYHLGYSSDRRTSAGRKLHLSLCFNPSHLEFVSPVVLGRVRAKQVRLGDSEMRRVLPLIIHGDAAFAGQGVVQETLCMSELRGYSCGGAIHVIVNNQIGFTTSPDDARSSPYATDVAKMLQVPVFHVNGEHPEAVAQVILLALRFRERFHKDVVIDMYCYRRYGHNETDEPAFTQPLMYEAIRRRKSVREGYLDSLLQLGQVSRAEADEIAVRRRQVLEEELAVARDPSYDSLADWGSGVWRGYVGGRDAEVPDAPTAVPRERLVSLMRRATAVPEGFAIHRKVAAVYDGRREMVEADKPLDWGAAEALALASLIDEGVPVRVSGQDSRRGTFSHRHAVVYDQQSGQEHIPLAALGRFEVWDSPLSEAGVLGFEYGHALDTPEGLTVWEAQFGDFANSAQVIIDQFIVSSEDKWRRLNGLVLLLPHGFEGQGPEHSSARLERFLMLSAEDNIQVVNLSTPAQLFHCLRRQVMRRIRKPLVIMSPKSLLRNPRCVSPLADLAEGTFQRVIGDDSEAPPDRIRRVLLCSGKVYHELAEARVAMEAWDVAILRVEQLFPLDRGLLGRLLGGYSDDTPAFWVQEEPVNMGAWTHLRMNLGERLLGRFPLSVVARRASASPATGSAESHRLEQELLIQKAFGIFQGT